MKENFNKKKHPENIHKTLIIKKNSIDDTVKYKVIVVFSHLLFFIGPFL